MSENSNLFNTPEQGRKLQTFGVGGDSQFVYATKSLYSGNNLDDGLDELPDWRVVAEAMMPGGELPEGIEIVPALTLQELILVEEEWNGDAFYNGIHDSKECARLHGELYALVIDFPHATAPELAERLIKRLEEKK